jgi:pimeloyl-ACP methyl ester carboxylesterase
VSDPLLFLHGLTIDNRDGATLARALPQLHVVSPNLPGHGGEPPARDWHPRALAAALDAKHPERAFIVGHSWGAAIAAWLAASRPIERLAGLVLLDGGWFDRADLPRGTAPRDAHQNAALEAFFASRTSEAWPALAANGRAGVPILAIAALRGDDDGAKARLLERFRRAVPAAQIESWTDVGHDLLRDAPDRVCATIAAFVRASTIE